MGPRQGRRYLQVLSMGSYQVRFDFTEFFRDLFGLVLLGLRLYLGIYWVLVG